MSFLAAHLRQIAFQAPPKMTQQRGRRRKIVKNDVGKYQDFGFLRKIQEDDFWAEEGNKRALEFISFH